MILPEKVALVTGASRGIGRATALALAEAGAKVAVNYARNSEAAEEVVREISDSGGEALAFKADVGRSEDVEALFAAIFEKWGRLDILVNNAGITRDGLLIRMKDADWEDVLRIDLTSAFLCTRAALRPMMKQRSGAIINISSVVGLAGNAGQANYAAAKAGLIGFTRSVAREGAQRGVRVNAIAPGYITTDMTENLPEKISDEMLKGIPLGRFGRPEDVADVAVFLASEKARYITGQVLAVDGGMTMY